MKTEQLQNNFETAEKEYQAVCARRTEARAELNAAEKEVERLRQDASTSPAKLAKLLTDLAARQMIFPAIEAQVTDFHKKMMAAKQAITDYGNLQKGKAFQLENMQWQLVAMQRDYAERESQLRLFADNIERHKDGIRALKAELGME